jgi:hypothetical protein
MHYLPANMMDAMMHPRLGHTYSNRISDIGIAMVFVVLMPKISNLLDPNNRIRESREGKMGETKMWAPQIRTNYAFVTQVHYTLKLSVFANSVSRIPFPMLREELPTQIEKTCEKMMATSSSTA